MVYVNHLDTVRTGNIRFVAQNNAERKQLGMYSSFADVEFRGRLGYKNLFSYFTNTLVTYLPSLDETSRRRRAERPEKPQAATVDNYYLVKVDVKEANNVAGIFLPGLELAEGTKLSFLFNPQSDIFSPVRPTTSSAAIFSSRTSMSAAGTRATPFRCTCARTIFSSAGSICRISRCRAV